MGRQLRVLGVAAVALIALLVVVAVQLVNSQSTARRDVQHRFLDRAKAGAALTESLFGSASSTSQPDNAKRYGGARVSPKALGQQAKQTKGLYLLLLSREGAVISASPGTPANAIRAVRSRPEYIRSVLAGAPFALSNIQGAGSSSSFVYAQSFMTPLGRRVLVSGLRGQAIGQFLGGYLKQVPNVKGGRAYVLDRRGAIVGSAQRRERVGATLRQAGLLAGLAHANAGSFGGGSYFASDTVKGTPWRIVLTGPKANLFKSVNGSRKWLPWLLFLGFAIAGAVALVLLGRVLRDAAKLATANDQLAVANRALEARAAELERSNEELDRFASIASHDLQEPLRKLQMFAGQLTRTESAGLSEKGVDYLDRMEDSVKRMQALIEDLLAFSRISTQARSVEPVDLDEIARGVVSDLDAVIEETGATVELGSLPAAVANPLQMRQLFQNLVSNALKFRREGVAPIVVVDGRVHGGLTEITVSDNGIGFEPRHAGRIFRVFERLHGRGDYGGTGIGLSLCRRIAERHGGSVVAEGRPGEGATFTVTLSRQGIPDAGGVHVSRTDKEAQPLVHA